MAHIIVVGNEKGGAGKSTVAMHIATALVRLNHTVGVLDLDLRQRSFGRYVANRLKFMQAENLDLPCPIYRELPNISKESLGPGENVYDHYEEVATIEDEWAPRAAPVTENPMQPAPTPIDTEGRVQPMAPPPAPSKRVQREAQPSLINTSDRNHNNSLIQYQKNPLLQSAQ